MSRPVREVVCGYYRTADGHCGAVDGVRPYVVGLRCPLHTPAALAGVPEPGAAAYGPPAPALSLEVDQ